MSHPIYHSKSSVKKFGGKEEDYFEIHHWFDETKSHMADFRHRAIRHHSEGIYLAERIFGAAIINSDGKQVPVRQIGEQHVLEDLGRIPTIKDWLENLKPQPWMGKTKNLEKEFEREMEKPTQQVVQLSPYIIPQEIFHPLITADSIIPPDQTRYYD